ncbi:putative transporter C1002.16c-like protein 1 [Colletotrichum chlorophyti]|uniref:Putative transporter C1002.16c-like protein 1 n=1 Tax=Colletotrichum chlorophyti TaxID=708187 RepID=A0A1Q8RUA1_9PEZI|nr:putative transporter C1002.16c-like protein 1 [Colletotrichum chlorophyti]
MGGDTFSSKDASADTMEKGPADYPSSSLTPDDVAMARPEWQATEKRLVWKLDVTLMPVVWTLYMFNYLDRNNLAQAKLNRFEEDLGLVGNQFNTAVSIFNAGYMIAQLPSNMLLTRVRPSIYLPCCVLLWSCVSASTAAAKNFSSLIAIRILLGVVEAPFFPGVFYVLSCWYTQKELAFRTAILYSGMLIATAFSGLIAAAVFAHLDGARGLAGWQWLFIIEGAGSFASAFAALALLPDYIGSGTGLCSWLMSEAELRVAAQRMEADRVSVPGGGVKTSVWRGLGLAVRDVRTWIFVCMQAFYLSSHGLNSFFPTIVKGFGLGSNTLTLVLTAPPYLLAAVVALCVAVSSDRRADRGLHIVGPVCIAMVGFVISAATLVGERAQRDAGEEGDGDVDCVPAGAGGKYLEPVLLQTWGWAEVFTRVLADDDVFWALCREGVSDEVDFGQGQPEIDRGDEGDGEEGEALSSLSKLSIGFGALVMDYGSST